MWALDLYQYETSPIGCCHRILQFDCWYPISPGSDLERKVLKYFDSLKDPQFSLWSTLLFVQWVPLNASPLSHRRHSRRPSLFKLLLTLDSPQTSCLWIQTSLHLIRLSSTMIRVIQVLTSSNQEHIKICQNKLSRCCFPDAGIGASYLWCLPLRPLTLNSRFRRRYWRT